MTDASAERYGAPAIALHWLVGALILATFPLGLYMTDLPLSPQKLKLYAWHKWIGVTVFGLAVLRGGWRLFRSPPPLPQTVPAWQRCVAGLTHAVLYGLLFAVPVSGWLYSSAAGVPTVYLGLWQLPDLVGRNRELAESLKLVHRALNYTMAAIVFVHVAAALKHQFVDGDGVLGRMLPFARRSTGETTT